jgi:hypothetical protein
LKPVGIAQEIETAKTDGGERLLRHITVLSDCRQCPTQAQRSHRKTNGFSHRKTPLTKGTKK